MIENKNRKGFTLVEVIVVITILAAAAAVAIPSLLGYQEKANQMTRDKDAKTVFLAAQNALTTKYTSGKIGELSKGNGKVDISSITPALEGTDEEENTPNIVYLYLDKDASDREGNQLYQLLNPYLNDKDIFNQSLLIEYNKLTGKMLSAFYSDEVSHLRYTGIESGKEDTFVVNRRSAGWLKENKVGYCAVDKTGKLTVTEETEETEGDDTTPVMLVDYVGTKKKEGNNINNGKNYGLLTLECQLPDGFMQKDSSTYEYYIKLNLDGQNKYNLKVAGSAPKEAGNLQEAMSKPIQATDLYYVGLPMAPYVSIPAYIDKNSQNGKDVLVLLLDSVAGPDGKYNDKLNIKNIRSSIGGVGQISKPGSLQASVEIRDTNGSTIQKGDSNPVNSFFGSQDLEDGKTTYEVSSIRHLNHLRDFQNNSNNVFKQTCDFPVRSYLYGKQNTVVNNLQTSGEGIMTFPMMGVNFNGTYDGKGYSIVDLSISGYDSALFYTVGAAGIVQNLTITYSEDYLLNAVGKDPNSLFINGSHYAAGIAIYNNGTIQYCSVEEANIAANWAGGIAIDNKNLIRNCFVAADITAGGANGRAAGIVVKDEEGINDQEGVVRYCEVGTASARTSNLNGSLKKVIGSPLVGNVSAKGRGKPDYPKTCENDVYTISAPNGSAGGIITFTSGSNIAYCVNAATVIGQTAGGIADAMGLLEDEIKYSYNAGTIKGPITAGGITASTGANVIGCYNTGKIDPSMNRGGIVGQFTLGRSYPLNTCYTLAKVGAKDRSGVILDDSNKNTPIAEYLKIISSGQLMEYPYPQIVKTDKGTPHRTPF